MSKEIYLDNAATTNVLPEVLDSMMPFLTKEYGNASSSHSIGRRSRKAIEDARELIADKLSCHSSEIIFTNGGSEANNTVIKGVYSRGKKIITSQIEHSSVLNCMEYLKRVNDTQVQYLEVDSNGLINLEQLKMGIDNRTCLISIMFANNEIGSIQPIKEIGRIAKDYEVAFHTDAVQAFGHQEINMKDYDISYMSVSGHKIHAPKGVGFLYARKGSEINPLIHGGHQEFGYRAGTENVAGIVGLAKATEIAYRNMQERESYIRELRDYFAEVIAKNIPNVRFNAMNEAKPTTKSSNNINVTIDGVVAEYLLTMLDESYIYMSSGSACNSGESSPSHVLKAIGLSDKACKETVRITIDELITKAEIDQVALLMKNYVEILRNI